MRRTGLLPRNGGSEKRGGCVWGAWWWCFGFRFDPFGGGHSLMDPTGWTILADDGIGTGGRGGPLGGRNQFF
jgi:hypothetical protein